MQIDRYTKTVLTVIAIALIGINIALLDRVVKPAHAATQNVYVVNQPPVPVIPVIPLQVYVTNAREIGTDVYVNNASEIGKAVGLWVN